ncbi:hypothetical protein CcCBS67573_g08109 [Chytriomyces confervae]|uniref:DDE Tnp4 domain-containing protein n=1 Tax=Chytriomyces confervae TaxID=246404 RepID=A0A507ENX4_9FUNG|nr:hypothetical protein CcCBS67573_g08109 [Chytriomyces confervae]
MRINSDPQKENFNASMSSVPVSVEWGFGLIEKYWAFCDYHKNLKLWIQPVGVYYSVACILTNIHTCMNGGNQISDFFKILPPSAQEYFHSAPLPN